MKPLNVHTLKHNIRHLYYVQVFVPGVSSYTHSLSAKITHLASDNTRYCVTTKKTQSVDFVTLLPTQYQAKVCIKDLPIQYAFLAFAVPET